MSEEPELIVTKRGDVVPSPCQQSRELPEKIVEIGKRRFPWVLDNIEALDHILNVCEIYNGNKWSISSTNETKDEYEDYIKLFENVQKMHTKFINARDRSVYIWNEYYQPIKILESLEKKMSDAIKRYHSYDLKNKRTLYATDEYGTLIDSDETLILQLAVIFEHYHDFDSKLEDTINLPKARKGISTCTLSPKDIETWSEAQEEFVKLNDVESFSTGKLQFFTGPFFWMAWGVFEILGIPHRKQARKADNGEFQNLCDDSHAFAKNLRRALDAHKSLYSDSCS